MGDAMSDPDPSGFAPLPPGGSRGQAVFEALRAALREGRLRPGMPLREEQVAQWFAVSRTPVREAFAQLLGRSLLEHAGGRGLVVRALRPSEVYELYAMREVLEGAAAGLAASHAGPAEIAVLEGLHARLSGLPRGAAEEAVGVNRDFHDAIRAAARNRYLDGALDDLADGIALLGETTLGDPERQAGAIAEHGRILGAIRDRDAGAAEAAARAHIRAAFRAREGVRA